MGVAVGRRLPGRRDFAGLLASLADQPRDGDGRRLNLFHALPRFCQFRAARRPSSPLESLPVPGRPLFGEPPGCRFVSVALAFRGVGRREKSRRVYGSPPVVGWLGHASLCPTRSWIVLVARRGRRTGVQPERFPGRSCRPDQPTKRRGLAPLAALAAGGSG